MSYKIIGTDVVLCSDGVSFFCISENADCLRFVRDWRDGAEVRNAEGHLLPYSEQAVRDLGLEPA